MRLALRLVAVIRIDSVFFDTPPRNAEPKILCFFQLEVWECISKTWSRISWDAQWDFATK